jgi:DNA-binding transcriptional regulator YiaG
MTLVSSSNFTRDSVDANDKSRGKLLQRAREDAGLDQDEAGEAIGRTRVTLSRWENGWPVPADMALSLLNLYRDRGAKISVELIDMLDVPRATWRRGVEPSGAASGDGTGDDSWSPNPALRNKIPKRAYDVAIAYCNRLVAGGWPREEIEQIERLMIDPRYAQANKRKGYELTEDEFIMLIDATWEAVKHSAAALGRQV